MVTMDDALSLKEDQLTKELSLYYRVSVKEKSFFSATDTMRGSIMLKLISVLLRLELRKLSAFIVNFYVDLEAANTRGTNFRFIE